MGKRELLIILGFVVVGAIAYQFTAPPATGNSSFSFGDFFKDARREIRGNPGQGTFVHAATVEAPSSLREVRLIGVAGAVQVVGEDRPNVTYDFTVTSNGPDNAGAVDLAKQTRLEHDDLGEVLILRARYPDPGSQTATIVLKVPARMAVRVESGRGITISNVATAHVEGNRGNVTMTGIAGGVTGIHQDGDFKVTGAASMKMRLLRSQAAITKVTGGLTLDVRDGDCNVSDSGGPMEVDETRGDITIAGHRGAITVRGVDGRITIQQPTAETRVDTRRAEVEVALDRGVTTTILTTDEPIRLMLAGATAIVLDAASTVASIQATEFGLTPETAGADMKLSHTFGSGGPRVTLRNTRGNIIVRKSQQEKK